MLGYVSRDCDKIYKLAAGVVYRITCSAVPSPIARCIAHPEPVSTRSLRPILDIALYCLLNNMDICRVY